MLARDARLRGDANFKRLARFGRPFFSSYFTLRVSVQEDRKPGISSRLAFVVSTKVSKSAVQRNTLRRRLREIVRAELPRLKQGLDILIIAKPKARELSFQVLKEHLLAIFSQARLYL